jgi:hypothetical protein
MIPLTMARLIPVGRGKVMESLLLQMVITSQGSLTMIFLLERVDSFSTMVISSSRNSLETSSMVLVN